MLLFPLPVISVTSRTGLEFAFPQSNGDVFAFTDDVNSAFQHAVPRGARRVGPRISVILWGRLVEGGAGLLRGSAMKGAGEGDMNCRGDVLAWFISGFLININKIKQAYDNVNVKYVFM